MTIQLTLSRNSRIGMSLTHQDQEHSKMFIRSCLRSKALDEGAHFGHETLFSSLSFVYFELDLINFFGPSGAWCASDIPVHGKLNIIS